MDQNNALPSTLTILNWNAKGLQRQRNIFNYFLHHNNIDIACVSETHLVENEKFKVTNYKIFRFDRICVCDHASGGAAIVIKKSIKHEPVIIPKMLSLEIVGVKIFLANGSQMKIYSTYLQPRKKLSVRDLNCILQNDSNPIIAAGDFNSKHPAWFSRLANPNGRILFNKMTQSDWTVCAPDEPTFFPTQQGILPDVLDIVICKNVTGIISQEVLIDLDSDHVPVLIKIDANLLGLPEPLKLITGPVDWEGFQSSMDGKIQLTQNINTIELIDAEIGVLTEKIKDSLKENMGQFKKSSSNCYFLPLH